MISTVFTKSSWRRLSVNLRVQRLSFKKSQAVGLIVRSNFRVGCLSGSTIQWTPSRSLSSRRQGDGNDGEKRFQLEALPFSISPQHALERFYAWANEEQGLHYLLQQKSVRIGAAYCPVWSFDVNVRFVIREPDGQRRFGWKPQVFRAAFGEQSVIHLPGLSAYSGYSYRRSLVNPIHNTTLVFLGNATVPFGNWMLRDMKLNGSRLEIFPDPWNTTRGRAFTVVEEELEAIAKASEHNNVEVQTEVVASRRVMMPTYVIDYKVFGIEYRAFVSGCDAGASVSGDSHKVFDLSGQEAYQKSSNFLTQAMSAVQLGARVLGGPRIFILLQLLGGVIWRILARIPVIGLFAGIFVGFRKVIQPYVASKWSSAEWERQREHEAYMEEKFEHGDDFVDNGTAQRYFLQNRGRILRYLSGDSEHEQGDFDWYKQWEEWARRQWQQQQQQAYSQQQQQTQQQERPRRARPKPRVDYQWDFDPSDPYSVLGITRGASKTEVSQAYRKQMLKYHPDTQAGSSEAERIRASERAKLINEAYRKIKAEMK